MSSEEDDESMLMESNSLSDEAEERFHATEALMKRDDVAFDEYEAIVVQETQNVHMSSDEENEILAEIKKEVLQQVRNDMIRNNELVPRRQSIDSVSTTSFDHEDNNSVTGGNNDENNKLTAEELKIQDALAKMRKLDRILLKKTKREREVKRERILMHQRLSEELLDLEKTPISKEIKVNSMKFLALNPPQRHNACFIHCESPPPGTPVFKTEFLFDETKGTQSNRQDSSSSASGAQNSHGSSVVSGSVNDGKKDFIRRNIELASHASETVAMTEEEKARLENLLKDIDFLGNESQESDVASSNAYAMNVIGDGFSMNPDEFNRMQQIDNHLQSLMNPMDYESICATSRGNRVISPTWSKMESHASNNNSRKASTSQETAVATNIDRLGEPVLQDVKEERDLRRRLTEVDRTISSRVLVQHYEFVDAQLSQGHLRELLSSCARSLSRSLVSPNLYQSPSHRGSIVPTASGSGSGAGSCYNGDLINGDEDDEELIVALMENPPKLDDATLKELLEDAYRCGIGAPPPALQQKLAEILEEEESMTTEEALDAIADGNFEVVRSSSSLGSALQSERMGTCILSGQRSHSIMSYNEEENTSPSTCETNTPTQSRPTSSASSIVSSSSRSLSTIVSGKNNNKFNYENDKNPRKLPDIRQFAHMTSPKPN